MCIRDRLNVAQYQLGYFYATGIGVKRDDAFAYAWADIAGINGNVKAARLVKEGFNNKLDPEKIAEGKKLSRDMIKKNPKLLNK